MVVFTCSMSVRLHFFDSIVRFLKSGMIVFSDLPFLSSHIPKLIISSG